VERLDMTVEKSSAEIVEADRFSGIAMVALGEEVIHKRRDGPDSADQNNHVDGRFRVGSLAKQFTAVASMQMIEAEKLRPRADSDQSGS